MATTYNRPDLAQLAFAYKNPISWFAYNQVAVPTPVNVEKGKYRVTEERAWYTRPEVIMSKNTVPKISDFEDSFVEFDLKPYGSGVFLSETDLAQPQQYGYNSRQDMIRAKVEWKSYQMRLELESQLYTFVSDNNNFYSASYYGNASTAWSSVATADPLSEVMTAKLLVPQINAMAINNTTLNYLQRNAKIIAASTVSGSRKDASVNPFVTVDFLRNYFNLQYLIVFMGEVLDDSSDSTDNTLGKIWGNKALLFHYNPAAGAMPEAPTWAKMYFMQVPGFSGTEGWIVNETKDDRVGLTGGTTYDVGLYSQFATYAKRFAYRIDALYS